MSWVCEVCSTNNDDDVKECFICGCERSAASIREGKRKAREARLDKISSVLCDDVLRGIKIGTMVAGALILLACIIKIATGRLFADLEVNISGLFGSIPNRFSLFVSDLRSIKISQRLLLPIDSAMRVITLIDVPDNAKAFLLDVGVRILAGLYLMLGALKYALPSRDKLVFFTAAHSKIQPTIGELFEHLGAYASLVVDNIKEIAFPLAYIFEKLKICYLTVASFASEMIDRVKTSIGGTVNYVRHAASKFIK